MRDTKKHPPLPLHHFVGGMVRQSMGAVAVVLGSLVLGMVGYASFESLSWTDAFLNAAMLLGGMGPVDLPHTEGGKLFAGFYALYSGLVFLILMGLVVGPVFHRVLHKFHWDREQ
ncbi:MAG TPA: hypothetical protein VHO25_20600 [Polyangiaceae bacterium]|nr:hypothetical protein [Polyangiaceae bacterium]